MQPWLRQGPHREAPLHLQKGGGQEGEGVRRHQDAYQGHGSRGLRQEGTSQQSCPSEEVDVASQARGVSQRRAAGQAGSNAPGRGRKAVRSSATASLGEPGLRSVPVLRPQVQRDRSGATYSALQADAGSSASETLYSWGSQVEACLPRFEKSTSVGWVCEGTKHSCLCTHTGEFITG